MLAGRHVLVAGAGVTGRSATRALLAAGAQVTVTDGAAERLDGLRDQLRADLGGERAEAVALRVGLTEPPAGVDLVVTSPGWRPSSPLLAAASARGVEVIGEVELAWRISAALPEPPRWLAVTGTNGKTTTVSMLESILRAAGLDAVACGNVGLPVVDAVLAGHRVLAVELSSFQLYWSPSVAPAAGVLLNVAEDHLDWHGTMADYVAAKARVLTGEVAVAGVDDPLVADLLAAAPAARRVGVTLGEPGPGQLGVAGDVLLDRAFTADPAQGEALIPVERVRPAGPPGVFDALAAAALARAAGVPSAAVRDGLAAFQPVAHRAELVAEHAGVRYVNDSKATNPHAAAASLAGYASAVWLAGGDLKGASQDAIDELVLSVADRLRGVVLLGKDRNVIAAALARHAPNVPVRVVEPGDDEPMTTAVRAALAMARPGDVVLLAPAAASWDMFTDYPHRGRVFTQAVHELTRPGGPGHSQAR
ncbi:UDP-N-acetylmuramoyl-L-alanine--D-glutamate ligase [Goodfellowiella coeruleoviolacea]|uniref:UDP-N-acetylmuramoyl-L-alanine--D-glutamate ligase n=1 Tax=Goodfellowiella coeruleoviolacea TaxID=334858 RepID=UPI0020A40126|nr:UDP-N-acetylmuramoyl-L-alanine--D-glutamate ligase [Goodfellowiella coeruleoviolacea]